jgi:hypothetical protein
VEHGYGRNAIWLGEKLAFKHDVLIGNINEVSETVFSLAFCREGQLHAFDFMS